MSQEHRAKISAGMGHARGVRRSLANRPLAKLCDDDLIAVIVAQSELAPEVQRHMIQSTLDLHVAMKGHDVGHEIWRASMEDICRRGRVEIEAANAKLLEVA